MGLLMPILPLHLFVRKMAVLLLSGIYLLSHFPHLFYVNNPEFFLSLSGGFKEM
jgi:hypothetical protein